MTYNGMSGDISVCFSDVGDVRYFMDVCGCLGISGMHDMLEDVT